MFMRNWHETERRKVAERRAKAAAAPSTVGISLRPGRGGRGGQIEADAVFCQFLGSASLTFFCLFLSLLPLLAFSCLFFALLSFFVFRFLIFLSFPFLSFPFLSFPLSSLLFFLLFLFPN